MTPNSAPHGCADHAVVTCHVANHAPDDGAFNTAMGVGNDRQRRSGNR